MQVHESLTEVRPQVISVDAHSKVYAGDVLTPRVLVSIHGKPVPVPNREALVHLQFRRYAGCA